jgi:hypothetical protein
MEAAEKEAPARLARVAGGIYLLAILFSIPGAIVLRRILAAGDGEATAAYLLAHEPIVRLAFALNLVSVAAYVIVTGLLFALFRPVSRNVSLIAALFSLVGCAVMAASMLFIEAPLLMLGGPHPGALGPQASTDLALLLTELYVEGYNIGVTFFGFYCLLIGWLIFASGFLPRVLGLGMAAGGLLYLTFLSAPLAHSLFPWNVLPGFLAECALTLWLLLAGVNPQRWAKRARP